MGSTIIANIIIAGAIPGPIGSVPNIGNQPKKEFKNKRGSIGIGIVEPWSKFKSFRTELF